MSVLRHCESALKRCFARLAVISWEKESHRKIVLCAEEDDDTRSKHRGFPESLLAALDKGPPQCPQPTPHQIISNLPQSQLNCRNPRPKCKSPRDKARWHNAQIGPKHNSQAYFAVRNVVWKTSPFCSAAAGASLLSALFVECGFCGQTVMHVMPQSSRPHECHFRIQPKLSSSL